MKTRISAIAALWALTALAAAGCVSSSDPRWQLDHDRIVAVRATPAHVAAGGQMTIDALVAHDGAPVSVEQPITVAIDGAPPALAGAVQPDGSIVAPDEAGLDQLRQALGLPAGASVPVVITVSFSVGDHTLSANKTIAFGDTADNPTMPAVAVQDAAPADDTELTVPANSDVPLSVAADPAWKVFWLSSCGTLHDDDEHAAILVVKPDDPQSGQLAVVVRDTADGVAWKVWPIQAVPAAAH